MRSPFDLPEWAIAVVIILVFVVALAVAFDVPTQEEYDTRLKAEIARCRELGGEPHLMRRGPTRYYVRECWFK